MFQGNWKCSSCGGEITELPFEPRSESGLTCRSCYGKQKDSQQSSEIPVANEAPDAPDDALVAGEPSPDDSVESSTTSEQPSERKMFSGDWKCGGCGATITELPFQPRETGNLKCIDCFKKSKGH